MKRSMRRLFVGVIGTPEGKALSNPPAITAPIKVTTCPNHGKLLTLLNDESS
ncbi:hypothetical protein [Rubritalea sp.]|uniref:hypothetical protein n=1 Tax=Rubritalea sp. TaxID=2109375 RepID=UPI003F4ABBB5